MISVLDQLLSGKCQKLLSHLQDQKINIIQKMDQQHGQRTELTTGTTQNLQMRPTGLKKAAFLETPILLAQMTQRKKDGS